MIGLPLLFCKVELYWWVSCLSILAPLRVAVVCLPRGRPLLLIFFISTTFTLFYDDHPLHILRSHEQKGEARATIVSSTNSLCPRCHTASVSLPWGGGLKACRFLPSSVAGFMMVLIVMLFHDVCWAPLLLEGGSIERQLPPSAQSHMPASTLFSVNDIPQHCPKNVDFMFR